MPTGLMANIVTFGPSRPSTAQKPDIAHTYNRMFSIGLYIRQVSIDFYYSFMEISWNSPTLFFKNINMALFSSKIFCKIEIVPLLFVFDKYYPIMD